MPATEHGDQGLGYGMYSIYSNDDLLKLSIASLISSLRHSPAEKTLRDTIYFTDQYYDAFEHVVSRSLQDDGAIIVIFTHQPHEPINIGNRIALISMKTSLSVICQFLSHIISRTLLTLKEVSLSETEMLFLFMYYKNWSISMMSGLLRLHEKTITNTKHFLKKKYGIKDDIMFATLSKSFSVYLNSLA